MKQGTTYPITITLKDIDLSDADWIIVSLKPQDLPVIEFSGDDLTVYSDGDDTVIVFSLTQAQSVSLSTRRIIIDVNWMLDGVRQGAMPESLNISNTLLTRVVNDGE